MSLTVIYFSFRGRGEQIRLLLHYVGATFEDRQVRRPDFLDLKKQGVAATYFGSLPVLVDGDFRLSQGPAIMNYLARKFSIAPTEPEAAARAEAITLGAEDLRSKYFGLFGDEAKDKQTKFLEGDWRTRWLASFEGLLAQNGDHGVFAGEAISQADIAVWDVLNAFVSYIPDASLDGHPRVEALYAKLAEAPTLASYLAERTD